jgi:hypothetical protein
MMKRSYMVVFGHAGYESSRLEKDGIEVHSRDASGDDTSLAYYQKWTCQTCEGFAGAGAIRCELKRPLRKEELEHTLYLLI